MLDLSQPQSQSTPMLYCMTIIMKSMATSQVHNTAAHNEKQINMSHTSQLSPFFPNQHTSVFSKLDKCFMLSTPFDLRVGGA